MQWIQALAKAEAEGTTGHTAYYGWPVLASVSLTGPEGNRTYVAYVANNPDNRGNAEGLADHELVSAYLRQFNIDPDDGWRSYWLGKAEILYLLTQMSDEASAEKTDEARSTLEQAVSGPRYEMLSELLNEWQEGDRLVTAELVEQVHNIINGDIEDMLEDKEKADAPGVPRTWRSDRDYIRLVGLVFCTDLALAILFLMFVETGTLVSGTFPFAHLFLSGMLTLPGLLAYFGYKSSHGKFAFLSIGAMELWAFIECAIGYQYGLGIFFSHSSIITHMLGGFAVYFPYAVGLAPVAFLALIAYFAGKLWPTKRPMVGMIAVVQEGQREASSRQYSPDNNTDASLELAMKEE